MYGSSRVLTVIKKFRIAMGSGLLPAVLLMAPQPTASIPTLLYDYQFIGSNGTILNSAPGGAAVPLTLSGDWQSVPAGVRFTGNTSGKWSVAYGRPASGYTLDEPSTAAVGFGSKFTYWPPANGTCFGDTPNIIQIGRYALNAAQAKIQLSSCAASKTKVMAECRFGGSLTSSATPPVVSTLPLIDGDRYVVKCTKSPDQPNGSTTITLAVTDLDATTGVKKVVDTFKVAAIGNMRTTQYISAANKYPLPPLADNTDQFNGVITIAAFCAGTPTAVSTCLSANLPTG